MQFIEAVGELVAAGPATGCLLARTLVSLMRRRHRRRNDTKIGQKRRPETLNPKPARGGDVLVRGEEQPLFLGLGSSMPLCHS